jgi:hypothetical protein
MKNKVNYDIVNPKFQLDEKLSYIKSKLTGSLFTGIFENKPFNR